MISALNVHDRLKEMHFFLNSSYFFFLQYLYEKRLLPKLETPRLYQAFNELLVTLARKQDERVQRGMPEQYESRDYWKEIRKLYREKQFRIVENIDDFGVEQHDGVIYRDCLYFRRECLARFFPTANLSEIIDDLERHKVLARGNQKKTKQVYRLNGLRFYVIPLKYLT